MQASARAARQDHTLQATAPDRAPFDKPMHRTRPRPVLTWPVAYCQRARMVMATKAGRVGQTTGPIRKASEALARPIISVVIVDHRRPDLVRNAIQALG